MWRGLRIALATLVALIAWTVFVAAGTYEGWWRPMPAPPGDTAAFAAAAKARYAAESKGNIALALLVHGKVAGTYFASHGKPVDGDTLFQVASMSKWVTAFGVMALVEQHRIDLDTPVSHYLKRWHLPPSPFDNNAVTVRRLLSHTAGLTDDLGYLGFAPGQKLQTLPQSLTRTGDPMPGRSGLVRVGQPAGSWRYSGGGFAMLQLTIEDVAGEDFNTYMRRTVLAPLGMKESTFVAPDPAHLATFYGTDGKPAIHYKFTALAAASLYTSLNDMTRFVQAQLPGAHGVVTPQTLALMRTPVARVAGIPIWGLGTILYTGNGAGGFIVGHDGNNYPAINTTARLDPATGDGIVMLSTGNPTLASAIGADWTWWHTGHVDTMAMVIESQATLEIFGAGAIVILLAAILVGWRGRRRAE
ncbi:MAG TPA: serine hydrolase domain-containing protein [Rhizomicrobium sp.]|jgi:CubicO group peptidase (beta-lactamase class C family)|nr:serine hydrolase domain-containing protein [Rhizomicrobium sp.]